jgi:hypothetical protein
MIGSKTEKVHELKIWPYYFRAIVEGRKKFELRKNDRGGFFAGETLHLREWDPGIKDYTGRETRRRILYVLDGPSHGIEAGYSCLSIGPSPEKHGFTYAPALRVLNSDFRVQRRKK